MKKISKVIAICAAAVMLLGSSMSVFAAASVATVSATATEVSAVTASLADGTAVSVSAVTEAKVTEAQSAAVSLVGTTADSVQIEKVFELSATISGATDITIAVDGVTAGQKIAVLHQKADGTWESVPVVKVAAGSVTATFTSLSPVAIVSYGTSPKTGEAFPAAGILCIVAFFGFCVCVKKFALN